jgi:chromate transporter
MGYSCEKPMDRRLACAYISAVACAPASMTSEPVTEKENVALATLMAVFFRVGITSFGGSTAAWVHREIVEKHGWLDEEGFVTALTLSQVLPGANPVNLAIYVGSMLRGGIGGAAAALGMVGPAFCVILTLGALYARFGAAPVAHSILAGLAAVGVGMTVMVGAKLTGSVRRLVPILIAGVIFIAVGVLHWSMIPVVVVMTPLSIGFEYLAVRKRTA